MGEHMKPQRSYSRIFWLAGAVTTLLLGSLLSARAQEPPAQQPAPPPTASASDQQPAAVIRKETKLVLVDAVVTDKKGNYVRDLAQTDFKVFEDNKEQAINNFSSGADVATQANGQRHYLILFFDNSTMAAPDQIQARGAAQKFIDANAGPDRLMAIVDFGGTLRIVQNFTANANLLRAAVSGVKVSVVDPNAAPADAAVTVASANPSAVGLPPIGLSALGNAEADFGARSMLLALRSLAKNLRTVPGRKILVLFSGGFPLTTENQSELTATIDACNKANVAIYALDARGLFSGAGASSLNRMAPRSGNVIASNQPSAGTVRVTRTASETVRVNVSKRTTPGALRAAFVSSRQYSHVSPHRFASAASVSSRARV